MPRLLALALMLCSACLLHAQSASPHSPTQRLYWHQLHSASTPGESWTSLLALQRETVRMVGYLQQDQNGRWQLASRLASPSLVVDLVLSGAPSPTTTSVLLEGVLHLKTPIQGKPQAQLTQVKILPEAAPIQLEWDTLKFTGKDIYIPELDAYYWQPQFEPHQWVLDGQMVEITGRVYWLDRDDTYLALVSKKCPLSYGCCGGPRPFEIMDVRLGEELPKPEGNTHIRIRGRLELNQDHIYTLNYVLHAESITLENGEPILKKDRSSETKESVKTSGR